jgi:hypothetical protein
MPGQFMFIFWFAAVSALLLALLLPLMRRWMAGVDHAPADAKAG